MQPSCPSYDSLGLINDFLSLPSQVCISESLRAYYIANVHAAGESNNLTLAWGCDIHLTRGTKAPGCADQCFACKTSPQIAMWVVCFPIYLVTGVPYRCYQKCVK